MQRTSFINFGVNSKLPYDTFVTGEVAQSESVAFSATANRGRRIYLGEPIPPMSKYEKSRSDMVMLKKPHYPST